MQVFGWLDVFCCSTQFASVVPTIVHSVVPCSTQCASVVPTVVNSVLVWFLHTVLLYTLFDIVHTV